MLTIFPESLYLQSFNLSIQIQNLTVPVICSFSCRISQDYCFLRLSSYRPHCITCGINYENAFCLVFLVSHCQHSIHIHKIRYKHKRCYWCFQQFHSMEHGYIPTSNSHNISQRESLPKHSFMLYYIYNKQLYHKIHTGYIQSLP